MALVYLLVGIFIFVRQDFYGLDTAQRIGLGALVTGYGIYRVIKGIIRYRSSKDDE
jgi:hypothetical protein